MRRARSADAHAVREPPTDPDAELAEAGVRVRTRDREHLRTLSRRAVRTLRRLYSEGPDVARRWREAEPRLTARENWARLYGVTDER